MNTTTARNVPQASMPGAPWWRHPMMWLVVGGPLVVVVAGFVTLWLAMRAPDPVLTVPSAGLSGSSSPAVQARNHAATPAR